MGAQEEHEEDMAALWGGPEKGEGSMEATMRLVAQLLSETPTPQVGGQACSLA